MDALWGKSLSNGKEQTAPEPATQLLFEILCLKKMLKGGSKGDPARISGMQKSTLRRAQPAVWLPYSLWRRRTNLFWHLAVKFTLGEKGPVVIPSYIRYQGHRETLALTWLRPELKTTKTIQVQQQGSFIPVTFQTQHFCVSWQPWGSGSSCPRSLASYAVG